MVMEETAVKRAIWVLLREETEATVMEITDFAAQMQAVEASYSEAVTLTEEMVD